MRNDEGFSINEELGPNINEIEQKLIDKQIEDLNHVQNIKQEEGNENEDVQYPPDLENFRAENAEEEGIPPGD